MDCIHGGNDLGQYYIMARQRHVAEIINIHTKYNRYTRKYK